MAKPNRSCPECRVECDYVVPSLEFCTGDEKQRVFAAHMLVMSGRPCSNFNGAWARADLGSAALPRVVSSVRYEGERQLGQLCRCVQLDEAANVRCDGCSTPASATAMDVCTWASPCSTRGVSLAAGNPPTTAATETILDDAVSRGHQRRKRPPGQAMVAVRSPHR